MNNRQNNIKYLRQLRVQHEYRTTELEHEWLEAKSRLAALQSLVDINSEACGCKTTPSHAIIIKGCLKPRSTVSFGRPSSHPKPIDFPCCFDRPARPCRPTVVIEEDCCPGSDNDDYIVLRCPYPEPQRRPPTIPALPASPAESGESFESLDSYDIEAVHQLAQLAQWTKDTERRIAILDQIEGVILCSLMGRLACDESDDGQRPKTRPASTLDPADGAGEEADVVELAGKEGAGPSEQQVECVREVEEAAVEEILPGECPAEECCPTEECCPAGECTSEESEEWTAEECTAEECPAGDCTAEECTAEECTAEECTAEECPAGDCTAEECTAEECTSEDCAAEECSAEECNAEECTAEECTAEECTAEECTAEECTAEECIAEEFTTSECSAEECTTEKCTAAECSAGDCTAETRPPEEPAAEESPGDEMAVEETAETEPAGPPTADEENADEEEKRLNSKMLTMKHNIDIVVDHLITCDITCIPGEEFDKINHDLEDMIKIFDEAHETEPENLVTKADDVECEELPELPNFTCCPGCMCTPPDDPTPVGAD